jgi:hypothetical protein
MEEVTLEIRFLRECLGAERRNIDGEGDVFCMHRVGDDVIFLPAWWRSIARYAARLHNRPPGLVEQIDWDPVVEGTPRRWRRFFQGDEPRERRRYAKHEAFRPGDILRVKCVLPDGLGVDAFRELMDTAGRYKGISPFKPDQYGQFAVAGVHPRRATPCGPGSV